MTATGLEEIPPGSHTGFRVAAVAASAFVLVSILAYLLTGGGSEIFQSKVDLRTYLSDAEGLTQNSPVRLNGVRVGNIRRVVVSDERDPARVALVEMSVHERFIAKIPKDSIAAVTADNLLGDKYIDIQAGRSPSTVTANGEIRSLVQNQFDGSDIVITMQAVLTRVDALLTQIERGDTRLGRFFNDDRFYNGLRVQLAGVQSTIEKIAGAKTPIGEVFFTDRLYRSLEKPILDIDTLLASLQKGEGSGGKLLADSSQYDNATAAVRSIRKTLQDINSPKGANDFLHDQALYDHSLTFVNSFGRAVDELNNGKGKVAELMVNPQLYNSLNGTSKSMRYFVKDFRENPRKYLRIKVF